MNAIRFKPTNNCERAHGNLELLQLLHREFCTQFVFVIRVSLDLTHIHQIKY